MGRKHDGPPKFPKAEDIFKRLDKDEDGQLSLEEFSAGVEHAKKMVEHAKKMMAKHHRMGPPEHRRPDGPPKGDHAKKGPGKPPIGKIVEHLKKADKDGDGKLSKEEAPERMKKHFDEIDKDDDGFVEPKEIKASLIAHAKKRAEMHGKLDGKKGDKYSPRDKKASEKKPDGKKKCDGPKKPKAEKKTKVKKEANVEEIPEAAEVPEAAEAAPEKDAPKTEAEK